MFSKLKQRIKKKLTFASIVSIIIAVFFLLFCNLSCQPELISGEGAEMTINNPVDRVDYIKTIDGTIMRPKIIDLPAWDMNNYQYSSVAHGLSDISKIVSVDCYVVNDAGTTRYNLMSVDDGSDPNLLAGGIANISTLNINFSRRTGGQFDGAAFGGAVSSRGHCVVWLKD